MVALQRPPDAAALAEMNAATLRCLQVITAATREALALFPLSSSSSFSLSRLKP
jgi:hypothetical protein